MRPFAAVGHSVEEFLHPPAKSSNINRAFAFDKDGNLFVTLPLNLPNSSYLKVPDSGLVKNLNSQYVNGRQPGPNAGNLVVLPLNGSQTRRF